jgi:hypothetical protein
VGLFGSARKVALTARYVASAGSEGGAVRLVPGEPAITDRLAQILRVGLGDDPPADALAVFGIGPGADPGPTAEAMAQRARQGARSVAVLIGSAEDRAAAERALLDTGWIEMSSITHVAALDEIGAREMIQGVVRALPSDERVAAARVNPALREEISRQLVRRSARSAGVLASGALGPQAGMISLAYMQVRMLGDLAAARDRNLGKEDAMDVAAVAGSSFIWRMAGRGAVRRTGRPVLARASVAYAATRGIGIAAQRRFSSDRPQGGSLSSDALKQRAKGLAERVGSLKKGRKP